MEGGPGIFCIFLLQILTLSIHILDDDVMIQKSTNNHIKDYISHVKSYKTLTCIYIRACSIVQEKIVFPLKGSHFPISFLLAKIFLQTSISREIERERMALSILCLKMPLCSKMSSCLLMLLILNSTLFSLMANGKWVNVTFPSVKTKFPKC